MAVHWLREAPFVGERHVVVHFHGTHRNWEGWRMKERSRVLQTLLLGVTFLLVSAFERPQSAPASAGWYTNAQAANGAKAYQKTCASCHGATLQGGMGPALVGRQFWLTYAGKKVSTLWPAVHTQMPMMAPGSVSAKNSTNIMAFLLQKNGVPAGTTPLDDTADLSKVLPSK
jgi:mono/diheme cytochrome c family protein